VEEYANVRQTIRRALVVLRSVIQQTS